MRNTLFRALSIAAVLLAAGLVAGAHASDQLLFDYVGYDYENPNPVPGTFGEVNSGYVGIGFVPVLFAPLVADTVLNEYTYEFGGLTSATVTPVGSYVIIDYSSPGFLRLYADSKGSGTHGTYGINPPNPDAPSTFNDGTLILEGELTGFQIVINTTTGSGSYNAAFKAVSGSQLGNLPLNQRNGWTFSGLTSNEINAPQGYYHQVDGQVFLSPPVTVEPTTWSRIKRGPHSN